MARAEARVFSAIWHDDTFKALNVGEQWLYFTLLSQGDLSPCGVLPDMPSRWAKLAAGTTSKLVAKWRDGLVAERFVVMDQTTDELLIRTLVRHDGGLKSPNLVVAVARSYGAVHSEVLREFIIDSFIKGLAEAFPEPFHEGFKEGLAKQFDKPPRKPIWERFPEPFQKGLIRALPVTKSSLHPVTSDLAEITSSKTWVCRGVAR